MALVQWSSPSLEMLEVRGSTPASHNLSLYVADFCLRRVARKDWSEHPVLTKKKCVVVGRMSGLHLASCEHALHQIKNSELALSIQRLHPLVSHPQWHKRANAPPADYSYSVTLPQRKRDSYPLTAPSTVHPPIFTYFFREISLSWGSVSYFFFSLKVSSHFYFLFEVSV